MRVSGVKSSAGATLLACTLLAACGDAKESDPRTAVPLVQTALAVPAASAAGSLTGVIGARIESDLGFRVSGQIEQRLVDAGQTVRRGQALMRIDARDLALGAAAQARLVESAAARLELARRDEERVRPIAQAGFASKRQYDAVVAALNAARADHAAAKAQAGVARNSADYAVLRADADGIVAEVLAEPGQVVAAGQPMVRLARAGAREAIVNVPENLRQTLGSAATASIYGTPGEVTARLRQLSAQANPLTRTFEARYVLAGPGQAAPLGATVTIRPVGEGNGSGGAVSVPAGALHDLGTGPGVWVITAREPVVQFRRVQVAQMRDDSVQIAQGLKPGERVVALGAHLLHEGDRVRLRP